MFHQRSHCNISDMYSRTAIPSNILREHFTAKLVHMEPSECDFRCFRTQRGIAIYRLLQAVSGHEGAFRPLSNMKEYIIKTDSKGFTSWPETTRLVLTLRLC